MILASVAAKGETLSDSFEHIGKSLSEASDKNARLGRIIIYKFARFGADINNRALLYYHHALSVRDGDDRAVGNNIIVRLRVGASRGYSFCTLTHYDLLIHRLTVEIVSPLVGKNAAKCACTCF